MFPDSPNTYDNDEGIVRHAGDPWEYKQVNDKFLTRRITDDSSNKWITTKEGSPAHKEIKTTIFDQPSTPSGESVESEIIESTTEVEKPSTNEKRKHKVVQSNAPGTGEWVQTVQEFLYDEGEFLGKSGTGVYTGTGIDGDYGPKTQDAIDNWVKTKKPENSLPIYQLDYSKPMTCSAGGCAANAGIKNTNLLQAILPIDEKTGERPSVWPNNAWFTGYDLVNKQGGKYIYHTNTRNNMNNRVPKELYGMLQVGDYVQLDRWGDSKKGETSRMFPGRKSENIEHLGVIVGMNEDGIPLVYHGSEKRKAYIQPINEEILLPGMTMGTYKYSIASIIRPKAILDADYSKLMNSPEYVNVAIDKENQLVVANTATEYQKGATEVVNNKMKDLVNIGQQYEMSEDDVKNIGQILIGGILQQESEGDESSGREIKEMGATIAKNWFGIDEISVGVPFTDIEWSKKIKSSKDDEASKSAYQLKPTMNFGTDSNPSIEGKALEYLGLKPSDLKGTGSDISFNPFSYDSYDKDSMSAFTLAGMILMMKHLRDLRKQSGYDASTKTFRGKPEAYALVKMWKSPNYFKKDKHKGYIDKYDVDYSTNALRAAKMTMSTQKGPKGGIGKEVLDKKEKFDKREIINKARRDKDQEVKTKDWFMSEDFGNIKPEMFYSKSESTQVVGMKQGGRISPGDIHDAADKAGIEWDDNEKFMNFSEKITNEKHLDDMNPSKLRKLKKAIDNKDNYAKGGPFSFLKGKKKYGHLKKIKVDSDTEEIEVAEDVSPEEKKWTQQAGKTTPDGQTRYVGDDTYEQKYSLPPFTVEADRLSSSDKRFAQWGRENVAELARRKTTIQASADNPLNQGLGMFNLSNWTRDNMANTAIADKGRIFPDDPNSFIDDWINPLSAIVGPFSDNLAASPKQARDQDSYWPYVSAIGGPLLVGALGGLAKNTGIGQFIDNMINPIPGISLTNIADKSVKGAKTLFSKGSKTATKPVSNVTTTGSSKLAQEQTLLKEQQEQVQREIAYAKKQKAKEDASGVPWEDYYDADFERYGRQKLKYQANQLNSELAKGNYGTSAANDIIDEAIVKLNNPAAFKKLKGIGVEDPKHFMKWLDEKVQYTTNPGEGGMVVHAKSGQRQTGPVRMNTGAAHADQAAWVQNIVGPKGDAVAHTADHEFGHLIQLYQKEMKLAKTGGRGDPNFIAGMKGNLADDVTLFDKELTAFFQKNKIATKKELRREAAGGASGKKGFESMERDLDYLTQGKLGDDAFKNSNLNREVMMNQTMDSIKESKRLLKKWKKFIEPRTEEASEGALKIIRKEEKLLAQNREIYQNLEARQKVVNKNKKKAKADFYANQNAEPLAHMRELRNEIYQSGLLGKVNAKHTNFQNKVTPEMLEEFITTGSKENLHRAKIGGEKQIYNSYAEGTRTSLVENRILKTQSVYTGKVNTKKIDGRRSYEYEFNSEYLKELAALLNRTPVITGVTVAGVGTAANMKKGGRIKYEHGGPHDTDPLKPKLNYARHDNTSIFGLGDNYAGETKEGDYPTTKPLTFEDGLDVASIAGSAAEPAGTIIDAAGALYYGGKAGVKAIKGEEYGDDLTTAGLWTAGMFAPWTAGAIASKVGKPLIKKAKSLFGKGVEPIIKNTETGRDIIGNRLYNVHNYTSKQLAQVLEESKAYLKNNPGDEFAKDIQRKIKYFEKGVQKDLKLQEIAKKNGRAFFDTGKWSTPSYIKADPDNQLGHVTTSNNLWKMVFESKGKMKPYTKNETLYFNIGGDGQLARNRLLGADDQGGAVNLIFDRKKLSKGNIKLDATGGESTITGEVPLSFLYPEAKKKAKDILLNEAEYRGIKFSKNDLKHIDDALDIKGVYGMAKGGPIDFEKGGTISKIPIPTGNKKDFSKFGFLQAPNPRRGRSPDSNIVTGGGVNYNPTGTGVSVVGVIPKKSGRVFKGEGTLGINQNIGKFNIGADVKFPIVNDWATGNRLPIKPKGQLKVKYKFKKGGKINPWAICTKSAGRKDKAKYERCVKKVKRKSMKRGGLIDMICQ